MFQFNGSSQYICNWFMHSRLKFFCWPVTCCSLVHNVGWTGIVKGICTKSKRSTNEKKKTCLSIDGSLMVEWSVIMSFHKRCKNTRPLQDKLSLPECGIYPGQSQRACTYLEKSPIDVNWCETLASVWSVLCTQACGKYWVFPYSLLYRTCVMGNPCLAFKGISELTHHLGISGNLFLL